MHVRPQLVRLFFLGAALLWPALLVPATMDSPALPDDWRTVRDLQNKADGAPGLPPEPGATGTMLLGAAELGADNGSRAALSARDYEALYSLLQRYRDELAGMGLDYDKMIARLDELRRKSVDLKERLDLLHPLDGVKIHGRAVTGFSDLHLTGNAALTKLPVGKPAKEGLRFQGGINTVDVDLEMTKGIISAMAELSLQGVWGGDTAAANFRRFYVEIRTPLVLQFGMLDTNLTPLTLWRNEDPYPFEPEPFKSRRNRARKDFQMQPDKLSLSGGRLSTDLRLFDSFDLELASMTSVISNPFMIGTNSAARVYSVLAGSTTITATSANVTYLEAWRSALVFPFGLDISYNGALFFDDPQGRPNSGFRPMNEFTQSFAAKFEKGFFFSGFEYALSGYTAPISTRTAEAAPLTGTAIVGSLGVKGSFGRFKLYGRSVTSGYHAAGAQVRTQDANYDYLGPLLTEITQVNTTGAVGIGLGLPRSPEPVWNWVGLIAPGTLYRTTTLNYQYAGVFSHLVPYNFLNDISPYGMATPNRQGFGADGELKILGGLFVPKAGFDMATNIDPVPVSPTSKFWNVDNLGNTFAATALPFTYQRIGAGLDINFSLGWPVKLTGGYTINSTKNGQDSWILDTSGKRLQFGINSTLLQGGFEVHPNEKLTVAAGYQHVDANGFSDVLKVSTFKGVSFDQMAYSVFWNITDFARVDIVYETLLFAALELPNSTFEADFGMIRFQVDF